MSKESVEDLQRKGMRSQLESDREMRGREGGFEEGKESHRPSCCRGEFLLFLSWN